MSSGFRSKLHNERGMAWIFAILLVAIIILSVMTMIPVYQKYQNQGKTLACAHALDTAKRQLAVDFMSNGFEEGKAEDAKKLVTQVMLGWDDLCPDGGSVYIVPREEGAQYWDVYCGLHGSDKKLCTRLNASNVLEQLQEALLVQRNDGNPYPESLPFTLHHKEHIALLVDEPTNIKRGTNLTQGYEGIVAFYSIVGHSDFGADSGAKEGEIWYFSYADEEYCANWNNREEWTGNSYRDLFK